MFLPYIYSYRTSRLVKYKHFLKIIFIFKQQLTKIPAGLEQKVTIDICAIAPNVLVGDTVGSLYYQLQIIAETEIIPLPIRATILLCSLFYCL